MRSSYNKMMFLGFLEISSSFRLIHRHNLTHCSIYLQSWCELYIGINTHTHRLYLRPRLCPSDRLYVCIQMTCFCFGFGLYFYFYTLSPILRISNAAILELVLHYISALVYEMLVLLIFILIFVCIVSSFCGMCTSVVPLINVTIFFILLSEIFLSIEILTKSMIILCVEMMIFVK